jgi:uncharacterized protein involved in copper resistance
METEDDVFSLPTPSITVLALAAAQDLESAAAKARKLHGEDAQEAVAETDVDCVDGREERAALEQLVEKAVLARG